MKKMHDFYREIKDLLVKYYLSHKRIRSELITSIGNHSSNRILCKVVLHSIEYNIDYG